MFISLNMEKNTYKKNYYIFFYHLNINHFICHSHAHHPDLHIVDFLLNYYYYLFVLY